MKKYSLIIALAVILTSCFDDPGTDITFEGSFVELDAAGTPSSFRDYTLLRENDGLSKDPGIKVNLASAALSTAVNVTVAVDPASTAIEGLHYTLNSPNVVIPAGEFTAMVDVDVFPDNIEAGEALNLILEIVSSNVEINSALDSATHVLQISCPIPAGNFLGEYRIDILAPGVFGAGTYGGADGHVVTVEQGSGEFDRQLTADYFGDTRFSRTFEFSLVCDAVKVPNQDHNVGCSGTLATGPPITEGTYDPSDDSSFIVNLTDNVQSDCGGGPVQASYRFVKL